MLLSNREIVSAVSDAAAMRAARPRFHADRGADSVGNRLIERKEDGHLTLGTQQIDGPFLQDRMLNGKGQMSDRQVVSGGT